MSVYEVVGYDDPAVNADKWGVVLYVTGPNIGSDGIRPVQFVSAELLAKAENREAELNTEVEELCSLALELSDALKRIAELDSYEPRDAGFFGAAKRIARDALTTDAEKRPATGWWPLTPPAAERVAERVRTQRAEMVNVLAARSPSRTERGQL